MSNGTSQFNLQWMGGKGIWYLKLKRFGKEVEGSGQNLIVEAGNRIGKRSFEIQLGSIVQEMGIRMVLGTKNLGRHCVYLIQTWKDLRTYKC